MKLEFKKYQGAGNHFIMIDNRKDEFFLTEEQISFLCNNSFGIGADGLIILSNKDNYDFGMAYFNSDGKSATMCGNGGRCIIKFASDLGIKKEKYLFMADDGEHQAYFNHDGTINLKMIDVCEITEFKDGIFVNSGTEHFIVFVNNLDTFPVNTEGEKIRWQKRFSPKGTNVSFVEKDSSILKIRTYEKGVESETLACGTGAVAACIASTIKNPSKKISQEVLALGGKLKVSLEKDKNNSFTNIWLTGNAVYVFDGIIKI